ncbi:hypothetical protein GA0074692_6820 [Micromonospora pallida]|uniref:Uncharacterized protein n=1 Tax=Micromonospora pallida TaxID=145854 RepID=A0A1C6TNK0_9ACTN|nr:hypothetical protein GA0074692_6820 [Micromonospora pallida]
MTTRHLTPGMKRARASAREAIRRAQAHVPRRPPRTTTKPSDGSTPTSPPPAHEPSATNSRRPTVPADTALADALATAYSPTELATLHQHLVDDAPRTTRSAGCATPSTPPPTSPRPAARRRPPAPRPSPPSTPPTAPAPDPEDTVTDQTPDTRAMPTGTELPGEHWNARLIREGAGQLAPFGKLDLGQQPADAAPYDAGDAPVASRPSRCTTSRSSSAATATPPDSSPPADSPRCTTATGKSPPSPPNATRREPHWSRPSARRSPRPATYCGMGRGNGRRRRHRPTRRP